MIQRRFKKWLPAVLLAAVLLAGCSGENSAQSTTADNNAVAQKASVTFTVQFPQSAVQKALIDERTVSVQVQWSDYDNYSTIGSTTLTPDLTTGQATATVTVPTGRLSFTAWAYENVPDPSNPGMTMEQEMEMISTAGEIVEGNNTVVLTFLGGDWQFVDASDNPLPMAVGSGASARTLTGFSLGSAHSQGMYAKAAVDYTKPMGWADYAMQWYGSTGAIGPQMEAWVDNQFVGGTTNSNVFGSDWLDLTNPDYSDSLYESNEFAYPQSGDRMVFVLDMGPDNGTFTDGVGNDLAPALDAVADSQALDGNHITGHLLELTFDSVSGTDTPTQTNIDCGPYWSYGAAAARSAAVKASFTQDDQGPTKAAPGDSSVVSTTLVAAFNECIQGPYATDGDGDGDMWYGDYLINDVNLNGLYDAGDTYQDTNNDGNFDWIVYNQVDGDGDGDMITEQLTVDLNHNWRFDAGDAFTDSDSDGVFDYVYTPGDLYAVTENFSNLVTTEFRAKGSQILSTFTPPLFGSWAPADATLGNALAITFLDATHYIHAEDGIAETTGGPGMEYGTYSVDATTGKVTFTATRDTTGDWGPAGTGTDTFDYLFIDTNHLQVSGTDGTGPWSIDLGRVSSSWNPVVGTWQFGSESLGMQVVTLFDNGNYLVASFGPTDPSDYDGMESGTYAWQVVSEASGVVTVNLTFTGSNSTIPAVNYAVLAEPGLTETVQVQVSNNGNTVSFPDGTASVDFSRVR